MMYVSVQELCGCRLLCRDGDAGNVQDVVLSRNRWHMRYVAVSLGREFGDSCVLLPLTHDESIDARQHCLTTPLSCRQVEWAAPYDGRPLTRRQEQLLGARCEWPAAWLKDAPHIQEIPNLPFDLEKPVTETEQRLENMLSDGPVTQSATRLIAGFTAFTRDGRTASVETLLVNTVDWSIPCLVVRCGPATKSIAVSTRSIRGIDWLHKHIYLTDRADAISRGPRYKPQTATRAAIMRQLDALRNRPTEGEAVDVGVSNRSTAPCRQTAEAGPTSATQSP